MLKPGGLFLLTVLRHVSFHGRFNSSIGRLSAAEAALGPLIELSEVFYRYSSSGWQIATDSECASCEYVAWVAWLMHWPLAGDAGPSPTMRPRGRACVRLVKP